MLARALGLDEGETPFPWQEELLRRFVRGEIPRSLDIPTGLGKTGVMAIWLVARALGAALPRRLVYVVDRRAVVDQATDVALRLREYVDSDPGLKASLDLGDRSLPISTLRGQYVDNEEWLEDPASPAIIVGTVDMIGSRLLFEGYGVTRKMRPYHAGLLGADTLLILDEAHLVPPFEKLLETIADGGQEFGPQDETSRRLVPPSKLLSLSATGRAHAGESFGLQDADFAHGVVRQRLDARKRLTVLAIGDKTKLADALAEQAWKLTANGARVVRCIVFCDRREDAIATKKAIEKRARDDKMEVDTELLVGGRRVFEREAAAKRLRELGFIAGTKVDRPRAAFLFATSAGEVGVDLDADHMVSDLVAWERMVQRLGRVNRRGGGEAEVIVVIEPEPQAVNDALQKPPDKRTKKESEAVQKHEVLQATKHALERLPDTNGARDVSPRALRDLRLRAQSDSDLQTILAAATTPAPLRPALSRALVDAWSMTSLKEHTGRPQIEPWLRGWLVNDPPQTAVIWRTHLPVRTRGGAATDKEIEAFFEAAPPHASEVLETETFRVLKWLGDRAKALVAASNGHASAASQDAGDGEEATESPPFQGSDVAAVALTPAGDLRKTLKLADLVGDGEKEVSARRKEDLERILKGATLIVDARIGGLNDGLLDHAAKDRPRTVDDGEPWIASSAAPVVRFRVGSAEAGQPAVTDPHWQVRHRFPTDLTEDGEPSRWLIVEKWRHDAATEEDRSTGIPQLLGKHHKETEESARHLARRLGLPDAYVEMLAIAGGLHDEGKRSKRWQRAFNASSDDIYAKTPGPVNIALLDGYRHEFGSLPFAKADGRLGKLPEDIQDLALHLIAAHHGFARPIIGTNGCEDAPPSALDDRAREIALRFARLQKHWGPWGLAWWEALLRAADHQASRKNDGAADPVVAQERV